MKKIVAILLLVAVVFTLSSCGLAIDLLTTAGLSVVNAIAPDYEEPECEFRFAELSITLTEAFADYSTELAGQFISYAMTQVLITRFENSLMTGAGLEELAEEFQSLLSMNFIEVEFSDTVVDGDIAYFTYWYSYDVDTKFFVAVYINEYASYVIEFACNQLYYDTYEPYFIKWAGSIKTLNSTSAI